MVYSTHCFHRVGSKGEDYSGRRRRASYRPRRRCRCRADPMAPCSMFMTYATVMWSA